MQDIDPDKTLRLKPLRLKADDVDTVNSGDLRHEFELIQTQVLPDLAPALDQQELAQGAAMQEALAGTTASRPLTPPGARQDPPLPQSTAQAEASQQGSQRRRHRSLFFRKRVPVLNQMSMVECGATCLAMILHYYGRQVSIAEIRDYCGIGRDGLSAQGIVRAAQAYGMRTRAASVKLAEFRRVPVPAIVHWGFNHFIVIERWTPQFVDAVDPALGRVRITAEEFHLNFTGVVIMLEPGRHFAQKRASSKLNATSYVLDYIRRDFGAFWQIIGASFLLQIFGLALPLFTKVALDQILPFGLQNLLVLLGIGLLVVLLAQVVTTLLREMVLLYLQTRIDISMMLGFFEHMLSLPQSFFQQRSSGDILARMGSNMVIQETISNQLISTLLDGSMVLLYFFILLSQSLLFTLLVLGFGLLQIALLLGTNRIMHHLSQQELMAQGKEQGYMTEVLVGLPTLKAMGTEQRALERWSNLFFEQMNVTIRRSSLSVFMNTALMSIRVAAPLALLWFGCWQVIAGSQKLGTALALNALATTLLGPLANLVNNGKNVQFIRSHLARIADVMEAAPEQDRSTVRQPPRLQGSVRLEQVSFQYDPHGELVLRDISLNIQPSQKVAIVGRSGSGKSTLGNLLLGTYVPAQGEIFYDNISLNQLDYQAVRGQFGIVIQNASLFSGSIRENIMLGDPQITMERVIWAAHQAAIHEDIMKMPMHYETYVAEGGNALSGGQRQRLALARALVRKPALLLLDEATSALDVVTERIIEGNLRALPCTQIIIAHRLSTVRNADLILVLDEGTIVERGSHEQLMSKNGYYARLIHNQLAQGEMVDR